MTSFPPQGTDDLVTRAGYSSGDTLPLSVHSVFRTETSTTQTSYQSITGHHIQTLPPTDSLTGDIKVGLATRLVPGSGETAFARLRNETDADNLTTTEVSSSSDDLLWSGFQDLGAATTGSPIRLLTQLRTDTGTNSSAIRATSIAIGVEL